MNPLEVHFQPLGAVVFEMHLVILSHRDEKTLALILTTSFTLPLLSHTHTPTHLHTFTHLISTFMITSEHCPYFD